MSRAVIYNPAAGGGRVGRRWEALSRGIEERLGDVVFHRSAGPGGAAEAAARAVREGATTVLSLGGDGTHNEVVNGIMSVDPAPGTIRFGVLPAGTGGDFARMLGIPRDTLRAAEALASDDSERPLDLGRVYIESVTPPQVRYFVNVATFGFGGLVDTFVNSSSKVLGGRVSFFLATLRALRIYRPATVTLELDSRPLGTFTINTVAIGNGRFCGGGMKVTPDADPGDGLFDVVVIEQRSALEVAGLTGRIYSGSHVEAEFVHTWRGRRLVARMAGENEAFLDIDGEAPGVIPATFEVVPGALALVGGGS